MNENALKAAVEALADMYQNGTSQSEDFHRALFTSEALALADVFAAADRSGAALEVLDTYATWNSPSVEDIDSTDAARMAARAVQLGGDASEWKAWTQS